MEIFSLEHSRAAYRADFALYGIAVLALAGFVVVEGPADEQPEILSFVLAGLVGWTAIEYLLHRFVLHGLPPFRRWHAEHHQRPMARICTPTVLSSSLIATLVFLPALAAGGLWRACGLTLGMLAGYLAYTVTHHATHHWRADNRWLKNRKRWHALHHHHGLQPGFYGVTTAAWDHVFGSAVGTARRTAPGAGSAGAEKPSAP